MSNIVWAANIRPWSREHVKSSKTTPGYYGAQLARYIQYVCVIFRAFIFMYEAGLITGGSIR